MPIQLLLFLVESSAPLLYAVSLWLLPSACTTRENKSGEDPLIILECDLARCNAAEQLRLVERLTCKKQQPAAMPFCDTVCDGMPANESTDDLLYMPLAAREPCNRGPQKKTSDLPLTTERPVNAQLIKDVYAVIDIASKNSKFVTDAGKSQAGIYDAEVTGTRDATPDLPDIPPTVLPPRDLDLPVNGLWDVTDVISSPAVEQASGACTSCRGLPDELVPEEPSTVV